MLPLRAWQLLFWQPLWTLLMKYCPFMGEVMFIYRKNDRYQSQFTGAGHTMGATGGGLKRLLPGSTFQGLYYAVFFGRGCLRGSSAIAHFSPPLSSACFDLTAEKRSD